MAGSTLQTRGFDVNVMPSVQLANPALFDPYGGIVRGVESGLGMGSRLQDIILRRDAAAAEAEMRPLRRQLMEADLDRSDQQMQTESQMNPLRVQAMQLELARANQARRLADVENPRRIALAEQPIERTVGTFQDLDEEGNLVEFGNIEFVDPTTGEKGQYTGRPLRTIKTAAQLEQERLNAEALRGYRANIGQAAAMRAATAEQVAAFKQQNPNVKTKQVYDEAGNVYEQVINPDGTAGEAWQVILPNGQPARKPQTEMGGLAGALRALSGADPVPAQSVAAPVTAPAAARPASVGANLDALSELATQFAAPPAAAPVPPPAAIQFLIANPQSATQFDQKYGAGAAARYLRRG